jgi:drug/metabolite transporter (DMT)-like permease
MHIAFAIAATILSAAFFVGGKVTIARHGMAWPAIWRWTLVTTGACGLIAWLALGAPHIPWHWCLIAGAAGSLAHVCANQALAWGDASVLVPVSGAKPLVMIPLVWLVFGTALPPGVMWACGLATLGIALGGLGPVRRHQHAPHPRLGFVLMLASIVLMTLSDLFGAKALAEAGPELRWATIAGWCVGLGALPALAFWTTRTPEPRANVVRAVLQGVLFTAFIAVLSLAIVYGADPGLAVAEVNIVIAFRGVVAILMVLALDRWFAMRLEPLPWWIHALRMLGAIVVGVAVLVAFI